MYVVRMPDRSVKSFFDWPSETPGNPGEPSAGILPGSMEADAPLRAGRCKRLSGPVNPVIRLPVTVGHGDNA